MSNAIHCTRQPGPAADEHKKYTLFYPSPPTEIYFTHVSGKICANYYIDIL